MGMTALQTPGRVVMVLWLVHLLGLLGGLRALNFSICLMEMAVGHFQDPGAAPDTTQTPHLGRPEISDLPRGII